MSRYVDAPLIEARRPFVIIGPGGFPFGSERRRETAERYALAIHERRGLACCVVPADLPQTCPNCGSADTIELTEAGAVCRECGYREP